MKIGPRGGKLDYFVIPILDISAITTCGLILYQLLVHPCVDSAQYQMHHFNSRMGVSGRNAKRAMSEMSGI